MRWILTMTFLLQWVSAAPGHPASGIAVDAQGRVFFTAGPMIVRVETNGAARIIVRDDKNEKFYQLHHIQRAPDGAMLTASDMGDAIWQFSPDGLLTRFYPPPHQDRPLRVGMGGDPFAVDGEGTVYAVNSRQDRFTQIVQLTAEGRVAVLAGGDWGYADGQGGAARFGDLHGGSMLIRTNGDLLLTDARVQVRRITPEGAVTTLAGEREAGYRDGPGHSARFDGACGLALDGRGQVLVVEERGRIRSIDPAGRVTTLAGAAGPGHRDGPLHEATFDGPTGIAVARNGDLFVLEPAGPRVRMITGGHVTTLVEGLP